MSYNYNRFKDTTVYGVFHNSDNPSGSDNANAIFDRNVNVDGVLNVGITGTNYYATIGSTGSINCQSVVLPLGDVQNQINTLNSNAASSYQTLAGMASYLLSTTAASTYQTIANMSNFLTTSVASSTYQTITGMSSYLLSATAASTYQTITGMSNYLLSATAASTYQTIANMSNFLTTSVAATTYQTIAGMSNYAPLASPLLSGTPIAPTASVGTNTTQIATTAFVLANAGGSPTLQTNTSTGTGTFSPKNATS